MMITQDFWKRLERDMIAGGDWYIDGDNCYVDVGPETITLAIRVGEDEFGNDDYCYHHYTTAQLKQSYESGDELARKAVDLIDAFYAERG